MTGFTSTSNYDEKSSINLIYIRLRKSKISLRSYWSRNRIAFGSDDKIKHTHKYVPLIYILKYGYVTDIVIDIHSSTLILTVWKFTFNVL